MTDGRGFVINDEGKILVFGFNDSGTKVERMSKEDGNIFVTIESDAPKYNSLMDVMVEAGKRVTETATLTVQEELDVLRASIAEVGGGLKATVETKRQEALDMKAAHVEAQYSVEAMLQ